MERLSPLMLVGAIIASDDLVGVDQRPTDMIQAVIPDAEALMEDCLASGELDQEAFIYCLQTLCALAGHLFWGRNLSYLFSGEFSGNCSACGHSLYFVVGAYGFFCVGEEWIGPRKRTSTQNPIFPSPLQHLSPVAAWLHQKAVAHDQLEVAKQILHLFGTTKCPECNIMLEVSPAITQASGSSGD
ncbi:hypothetical protein [Oleomonas cavernae]|uniref:hypothetical protein n=1 Tax=Oleomonas cavernae TaxID=2320859 RepID=UPI0011C35DEF|nr:hypothetical protein [Oleomonas cavernae]